MSTCGGVPRHISSGSNSLDPKLQTQGPQGQAVCPQSNKEMQAHSSCKNNMENLLGVWCQIYPAGVAQDDFSCHLQ